LRQLPAVDVLRTVWSQHFRRDPLKTSVIPLDTTEDVPAAQTVQEGVQMLPTSSVDDGQRGNILVTPHDPRPAARPRVLRLGSDTNCT
jgi:hypothetical protein